MGLPLGMDLDTVSHVVSWSHELGQGLPLFQCKCSELNNRVEENGMPYFLTDEFWTQVRELPKTMYVGLPLPWVTQVKGTRGVTPNHSPSRELQQNHCEKWS